MSGSRLSRVFAGYALLWALSHLPALLRPWWFLDDFGIADVFAPLNVEHHLEQGRPGQLLWMSTFLLDGGPQHGPANMALRLAQGTLHALAATLVAALLWRETGRWATLLSGIPFLLWPYSSEAVLWRAAGQYPAAAVLSLAGLFLLRTSPPTPGPWVGCAALLAGALLTHQLSAMAGLVVWCLAEGLAILSPRARPAAGVVREAAALVAGYGGGALASFAVAWTSAGDPFRLDPAASPAARLQLLFDLNLGFFTSGQFYPPALASLQIALLSLGLTAVPFLVRRLGLGRAALVGLALAGGLVAPYAALLPVAESYVSWRLHYLAPLVLSGAFAVAEAAGVGRALRIGALVTLAGLALGYAPLAWRSSAAYPRLFDADLGVLRELERVAAAQGSDAVCVVTAERLEPTTLNPHGIDFRWGGVKLSALLAAARPFLRWFSPLEMIEEEPILTRCVVACAERVPRGRFAIRVLPDGLPCLCPP
jgi:hypothetical protein